VKQPGKRQPPPGRNPDTTRIEHARDQQQGERVLDERSVLVVDEAGMLGSRKLARLLDYAAEARSKIVLVGDDKQLAAIEAGGGFRGLRLRLGASTLTENRRQAEPWEREAVEHLRDGNIDAALSAYRAHERLVAVETPRQLKETMLADWWQSFQHGNRVVILAYRRDEVDQFNTACQQLRDAEGHLGAERLTVWDRSFAVGDQVVCGKNAIRSFGVANATRGQVVALDLEQHSMTLKLEDGREVALPQEYLDKRPARWVGNNPDRRTVDLAYATTGHKAQGITRDEVLVRVTSAEDRQWLHVASSRAIGRTRYYSVISPEPASRQDREREVVDVPAADRTPHAAGRPDGHGRPPRRQQAPRYRQHPDAGRAAHEQARPARRAGPAGADHRPRTTRPVPPACPGDHQARTARPATCRGDHPTAGRPRPGRAHGAWSGPVAASGRPWPCA
jgi:AAA domain